MLRVQHLWLLSSSPAAVPIYPARPVWYRVQTGAACPASGLVCRVRSAAGGLPCIWHGLPCYLCCAVRPGALGAEVSTRGVYRERRGWGRSCPLIPKQIKKAFPLHTHPTFTNPNPSDCASLQKFRKIQKDPFQSLDCAIIS